MTTDRPATEALPRARLHAGTMPATRHSRWMTAECEPGLVSVIIPTYNRARLLVEAMDSVFAQTYRPIELIVVDDGSKNNTPQVLQEWAAAHARDPRFRMRIFHEENKGAPVARNLGLIESRGEFIQFLDSDDLLGKESRTQAKTLASLGPGQRCMAPTGCSGKRAGHVRESTAATH